MTHKYDYGQTKKTILQVLNKICWLNRFDIYLAVEQSLPDIEYETIRTHVYQLKKEGFVVSKKPTKTRVQQLLNVPVTFVNSQRGVKSDLFLLNEAKNDNT